MNMKKKHKNNSPSDRPEEIQRMTADAIAEMRKTQRKAEDEKIFERVATISNTLQERVKLGFTQKRITQTEFTQIVAAWYRHEFAALPQEHLALIAAMAFTRDAWSNYVDWYMPPEGDEVIIPW